MYCAECGTKKDGAKFCPNCGTPAANVTVVENKNEVKTANNVAPVVGNTATENDLYDNHVNEAVKSVIGIEEEILWTGTSQKGVPAKGVKKSISITKMATSATASALTTRTYEVTTNKVSEKADSLTSEKNITIEIADIVSVELAKRGLIEKSMGIGDVVIKSDDKELVIKNIKEFEMVKELIVKQTKVMKYNVDRYNQDISGNVTRFR